MSWDKRQARYKDLTWFYGFAQIKPEKWTIRWSVLDTPWSENKSLKRDQWKSFQGRSNTILIFCSAVFHPRIWIQETSKWSHLWDNGKYSFWITPTQSWALTTSQDWDPCLLILHWKVEWCNSLIQRFKTTKKRKISPWTEWSSGVIWSCIFLLCLDSTMLPLDLQFFSHVNQLLFL